MYSGQPRSRSQSRSGRTAFEPGRITRSAGGGAFYEGEWHERAALGEGAPADPDDITRALRLVARSVLLWLAVIAAASATLAGLKAIGHA